MAVVKVAVEQEQQTQALEVPEETLVGDLEVGDVVLELYAKPTLTLHFLGEILGQLHVALLELALAVAEVDLVNGCVAQETQMQR
jgi:hypothetical protein